MIYTSWKHANLQGLDGKSKMGSRFFRQSMVELLTLRAE
jgi:hypothetical protein